MTGHRLIISGLLRQTRTTESETFDIPDLKGGTTPLTLPAGIERWEPAQGLKPGDELQDADLEGCITNEQHWHLIQACGITDVVRHCLLLAVVGDITEQYDIFSRFEREHGAFCQHRQRLREIGGVAKRLTRLLEAEPLDFLLVWPIVTGKSDDLQCEGAEEMARLAHAAVASIGQRATALANNTEELRTWRCDECCGPEKSAATGKSPERRFIWEPTFALWRKLDRGVGYSENGPIMRFLRVLHRALGIPDPKGFAVRQAINDFNGRPRVPTKRRQVRHRA